MAWNLRKEDLLQIAAMRYLRLALPSGSVVRSIDHGTKMNDTRRMQLHARGVRGGLPDIMIWSRGMHAQIELKAGTAQSPHQVEHQALMEANGFNYGVCHSLEEIEATLRGWGWALSASVQATPCAGPAPKKRTASRPRREPRDAAGLNAMARSRGKGVFA